MNGSSRQDPPGPLSHELRERIGRAIHEGYRSDQTERKPADDPAMADWERLPEHLRESNRKQATVRDGARPLDGRAAR